MIVSLVVIMFELTYSLVYSVPIMIAVMMAKWVADAMYLDGLYDLLIELQGYPFLDSRKTFPHSLHTVRDLVTEQSDEEHPFIDTDDDPITVGALYKKLEAIGYTEDGGFPILSNGGRTLEGYIATSELSFALDQLSNYCYTSPYPITEQECMNVPCYFRRNKGAQPCLIIPIRPTLSDCNDSEDDDDHEQADNFQPALNDLSIYVDQVK